MTQEEAAALLRETGALLEGHFVLTSGLHSARYVQCAKVLQYPRHAERICGEIAGHFRAKRVEVVISPALGGIVVGQEVGRQLGARTMFAERQDGALRLRRGFEIRPGERVLVCEDVITTGGSVRETADIALNSGGDVVGIGAVVDRSGGKSGLPHLHAPLTLDERTYRADACPLCKEGIPVQKPGSRPDAPGAVPRRSEPNTAP